MTLKGNIIFLRALEPADLDFLYLLENDESIWEISSTTTPYSKFVLQQYLDHAHRDIYEVKQLRLAICKNSDTDAVGFIDLFDFDPKHSRIGVGILIFSEQNRGKGFGQEALSLICNYAKKHLLVHQVYANVEANNEASKHMFEKAGFIQSGMKKDWIATEGGFKNEIFYQLLY